MARFADRYHWSWTHPVRIATVPFAGPSASTDVGTRRPGLPLGTNDRTRLRRKGRATGVSRLRSDSSHRRRRATFRSTHRTKRARRVRGGLQPSVNLQPAPNRAPQPPSTLAHGPDPAESIGPGPEGVQLAVGR